MTTEPEPTPDSELNAALEAQNQEAEPSSRQHALTHIEANRLASATRPTVVVLAGTVETGKTTLITSLYERFGNGPIGGTRFSHSETLPGFEARARGLRPVNGVRPGMPHTYLTAVPWLHLKVRPMTGERAQDLLLGDFDGELFDRVVDGRDSPEIVPALRRADHLMVVIDGNALVTPALRPSAVQRARDLITRLCEPEVIAAPEVLSLVLTKVDLINAAESKIRSRARAELNAIREHLTERSGVSNVPMIETAAISNTVDLPVGHGAEELLDRWRTRPAVKLDRTRWPEGGEDATFFFGRWRA